MFPNGAELFGIGSDAFEGNSSIVLARPKDLRISTGEVWLAYAIMIAHMKQLGEIMKEKNITLDTFDPVSLHGFTQVPNFILRNAGLSTGAKVVYSMFLSYAWHNESCFPGQDRLAQDMGMSRSRVTEFVGELERAKLVTIERRGQGKTNLYTIHFQVKGTVDKTPRSRRADI
jgi:Helix-turn-helix domain